MMKDDKKAVDGSGHVAARESRLPLVPPSIAWPAFVVLLLLLSVGVSMAALWAANSDGGAILVRDPVEQTNP